MLNAVWVAVIVAVGCWLVLVAAATFVLVKLARLITQTSAAVSGLRDSSDALIDRAHATLDATAGQLSRTDEITASMDEVAANMAELTGRVTAFAPLARLAAASAGTRFARVPALLYGVRHAAELRSVGPGGRPAAGSSPRVAGSARTRLRRASPRQRGRPGPFRGGVPVIRRVFWLTAGAALGIAGYRRATAMVRRIAPAPRARQIAQFASDVREGMELYQQRPPRQVEPRQARPLPPPRQLVNPPTDHVEDGR